MSIALQHLKSFVADGSFVVLLFVFGVYVTVKTNFFQVRGASFIWKKTMGTLLKKDAATSGISPFQAVSTALAGTMGVGNIAGVATALTLGGPGAIFWMWVSAFFGMMTKYAEIYLAVRFREKSPDSGWRGGPMYYMEHGLGKRWMGCVFALFCALGSFGIGNMTQVNAVSEAALEAFHIPAWGTGALIAVIVALVVFGGIRRVATVNEILIPFVSIAYIVCSLTVLWRNGAYVGGAFSQIVSQAFTLRGTAGGAAGYGISSAIRYGMARGVFTNEAGLGSAPIAHASADCKSPAHQSVWGIFEVFLDTIVVCTLTALVLLTAQGGALWQGDLEGVEMTAAAFSSVFGPMGAKFIAVSVMLFAVAGMLGWCFYGETAVAYLAKGSKGAVNLYRVLFIACIVLGAVSEMSLVWELSDLLNALMAIPNVAALFLLRRQIRLPAR